MLKHNKIIKFLGMASLVLIIVFASGCSDSSSEYGRNASFKYILDHHDKKIHKPRCYKVGQIYSADREGTDSFNFAIGRGFTPCSNCNPQPYPHQTYTLNTRVMKIHYKSCPDLKYARAIHLEESSSYFSAVLRGFKPCSTCNPQPSLLTLNSIIYLVLLILSLVPIFIITFYSRSRSKAGHEPPKVTTLVIIMLILEYLTVSSHEAIYYAAFDQDVEMPLYLILIFGTCIVLKFAHEEYRVVDGTIVSFSQFKRAMKKEYRQILKEPGIVKMPRHQLKVTIKGLWEEYPLLNQNTSSTTTTNPTQATAEPKSEESKIINSPSTDNITHSATDTLFCRKCGTKLFSDSTFCHKCGTEVMTTNS